MTKEEAKELLPIIQAFAEGKTIQCRTKNRPWFDLLDNKLEMCGLFEYRIKPEPKYRPFKTKEECWNEMLKHQPFGWLKNKKNGDVALIGNVCQDKEVLIIWALNHETNYASDLFNDWFFADGTPFGIKEE